MIIDMKGRDGYNPKERFKVVEFSQITNADYIHAMNNKELANFLCHSSFCDCCVARTLCHDDKIGWLNWLEQNHQYN